MILRTSLLVLAPLLLNPSSWADTLTGLVVDDSGSGVSDVDIDAVDLVTGLQIPLTNDSTGPGGAFSVTLPSGSYRVTFEPPPPPAVPLLSAELPELVVAGNTSVGTIALDEGVVLSGRVLKQGGGALAGVDIDVIDPQGKKLKQKGDLTAANGTWAVAVPTGTLTVRFDPTGVPGPTLAPETILAPVFAPTDLGDTVLGPGFLLSLKLVGPGGPAVGLDVDLKDSVTGEKLFTPGDDSNAQGQVAMPVVAGTYDLSVCTPVGTGLAGVELLGIPVTADVNLGTVPLPAGVLLSGTVTASGLPLAAVDVDLFDPISGDEAVLCDDNSDLLGAYAVLAPAGTWDVVFRPAEGDDFLPFTASGVELLGPTVVDADLLACIGNCTGTVVTTVVPSAGPFSGGALVAVFGGPFPDDGSLDVTFGESAGLVVSVATTSVAVVTPAGVPGTTVDVAVSSSAGDALLLNGFTYAVGAVAAVQPSEGPAAGGTIVTLTGDAFEALPLPVVSFGGKAATVLSVEAPHTLVVEVPPGASDTPVDVAVQQTGGLLFAPAAYTYGELELRLGDGVQGTLPFGDLDSVYFEAPAGAIATLLLKRGKASTLAPDLQLEGPAGTLVAFGGAAVSDKLAAVKKLALPHTGSYVARLAGADGSAGSYKLTTKAKWPLKVNQEVTITSGDAVAEVPFAVLDGWMLKVAKVKSKPVKGDPVVLLPELELKGPSGQIVDLAPFLIVAASGKVATLKKLPLGETGEWVLRVGGAVGSTGVAKVTLKLAAPKLKKQKLFEPG